MSDAAEVLKDADERGLRRALIVTALPLERDAVRAHLTELGVCVGDDDELYECYEYRCGGKIGDATAQGWLVIVAECGAGTHVAQSAVMYANQMFKPFEVILFIGIAASRKKDIVIGSVIASDRIYLASAKQASNAVYRRRNRSN
jgi:nucleoside phosphorylase